MKIGIIGAGNVAKALAKGLIQTGHEVQIGARDTSKLMSWTIAPSVTLKEAAQFGQILILAPNFAGVEDAIQSADPTLFVDKVIIDVTNPIAIENGKFTLTIGTNDSAGEYIQRLLPNSHVVKAFNTVGAALMTQPEIVGGADMFIAGNSEIAKNTVTTILQSFGWRVRDLGGIENSRWLEALVMVGIAYGMKHQVQHNAFQLKTA